MAIDLSWDICARFAQEDFPKEFYDDWITVAEDESRVFITFPIYFASITQC
jgi:uncharacterized ferritin-like protein (DUF455 family)